MTAAPAIKGWCPTLLSPMQSGDGWLARVKPSAGVLSAAAARLIADAARRHGNGHIDLTSRANLQVRGLSPRSAEDFAETIIDGRSRQYQPIAGSDPQCHGEPARARRFLCRLRLSCRCARHRSHALPASPRFGRCRRSSASSSMAAARCRWQTSPPTSWSARARGSLPSTSMAGCLLRFALHLAHRSGEGSRARLPSPVRATEREAAPHARAGDGGRRGGDFRRCRPDRRPRASPTRARSKIAHRIDIIGISGAKRLRRWPAFRPHRSQCITRACRHLGALRRWKRAHHALARAVADRCLRKR